MVAAHAAAFTSVGCAASALLSPHVSPEDVGDAVAETHDRHASATRHGVEEGLHLLDAADLVDDLLYRRAPPKVERDEAAGQLGDAVLEAAPLAEPSEHFEGFSVLVQAHRYEQAAHPGVHPGRGAGKAARSRPRGRGHRLPPSPVDGAARQRTVRSTPPP